MCGCSCDTDCFFSTDSFDGLHDERYWVFFLHLLCDRAGKGRYRTRGQLIIQPVKSAASRIGFQIFNQSLCHYKLIYHLQNNICRMFPPLFFCISSCCITTCRQGITTINSIPPFILRGFRQLPLPVSGKEYVPLCEKELLIIL